MRRNSGNVGPKKNVTTLIGGASGIHDTFDVYNYRRYSSWPFSYKVTSLSVNSGTVYENSSQTITVNTSGFEINEALYWTILHGTTSASDFYNSTTSGSWIQSGSSNTGSFTFYTGFVGNPSKATRTFQIQIRLSSTFGPVIYTSGTFSIPAVTSSVSFTASPITETGSDYSNLVVTMGNMGTYIGSFSANVSISGSATAADFSSYPTSTILASGQSSTSFIVLEDFTTEGTESLTATVTYSGYTIGSAVLTINDTSTPITATVTPTASSVNEGSSVTFNISITSGNFSSGTLYWTLSTSGTVANADFSSPSNAVTSGGSVSISSSAGSVSFTLSSDASTESAAESFQLQLRRNSTSGTIITTSSSVTINDTSQGGGSVPTFASATLDSDPGDGAFTTSPGYAGTANQDEANVTIDTGISFTFQGVSYTRIGVSSNSYVVFGTSGTTFSYPNYQFAASSPAYPGIGVCAHPGSSTDSSWTFLGYRTISGSPTKFQIRFRGGYPFSFSGTNRIWDMTFTNGSNVIKVETRTITQKDSSGTGNAIWTKSSSAFLSGSSTPSDGSAFNITC